MLNYIAFSLLFPLVMAVFGPVIVLSWKENIKWRNRYILAAVPAAYTGFGWWLTSFVSDIVKCQGGLKDIHGCWLGSVDVTPLINYGFFLMLVFLYALPLSLWLLLNTLLKQAGLWHKK